MIMETQTSNIQAGRAKLLRSFMASVRRMLLERPLQARDQAQLVLQLTYGVDELLSLQARRLAFEILGDFSRLDDDHNRSLEYYECALEIDSSASESGFVNRVLFSKASSLVHVGRYEDARRTLRLALTSNDTRRRAERWLMARYVLFEQSMATMRYSAALRYANNVLHPDSIISHPLEWCNVQIGICELVRSTDPSMYRFGLRRLRSVSENLSFLFVRIRIAEMIAIEQFNESRSGEAYSMVESSYAYYVNEQLNRRATELACRITWMSMRHPFRAAFEKWQKTATQLLRRNPYPAARRLLLRSQILMSSHEGKEAAALRNVQHLVSLAKDPSISLAMRAEMDSYVAFALEQLGRLNESKKAWSAMIERYEATDSHHLAHSARGELAYVCVLDGDYDSARSLFTMQSKGAYGLLNDHELKSRLRTSKHTSDLIKSSLTEDKARIKSHAGMMLLKRSQSIFELQAVIDVKQRRLSELQRTTHGDAPNLVAIMHDLKNALASIQIVALSGTQINLSPATRRVLEAVRGTLQWLSGLISHDTSVASDILHNRLAGTSAQSLDDLLTSAISVSVPVAQLRKLRIILHLPTDEPRFIADDRARLLRSAIFNAITNAVKYADQGSTVHIGRCSTSEADVVYVNNLAPGLPQSALESLVSASTDSESEVLERLTLNGQSGLGTSLIRRFCDLLSVTVRVRDDAGIVRLSLAVPVR